jgi:protein required for attachment to host cells
MKKITTWVLVADGGRASVLLNDGPGRGLVPIAGHRYETELPPDRELRSDRPGRTFESADSSRHGISPPTDYHRLEKERFIERLAGIVDDAARTDEYDRLVIVAPPQALGVLRQALGDHARAKLTGELNKDLTDLAPEQVASRLGNILAV